MTTAWRWDDELASEPLEIPQSWSDYGAHEPAGPDEVPVYAVQVRFGPLLLWTLDNAGNAVDGPHQDKPAARVVYVTADGRQALERVYDAERNNDGWIADRSEFVATTGADPDSLEDVQRDPLRRTFRSEVAHRYDVDASHRGDRELVADGGFDLEECPDCSEYLNVEVSVTGSRYWYPDCERRVSTREVLAG